MSEQAVEALRAGRAVVLPTDTVYGLAVAADQPDAAEQLYTLKGRAARQPIALIARDVDTLLELVPELAGAPIALARALLPASLTLVLPNPRRRFDWLTGGRPETLGVRVPVLPRASREVVDRIGAIGATSANASGAGDAATLDAVPEPIRAACGAVVDGGRLAGTASTVVDFTGGEPRVLREGAVAAADVLARARDALA